MPLTLREKCHGLNNQPSVIMNMKKIVRGTEQDMRYMQLASRDDRRRDVANFAKYANVSLRAWTWLIFVTLTLAFTASNAQAAFLAIPVGHSSLSSGCATCHDGVQASAKSSLHIASTAVCEACHSPLAWRPVKAFSHAQLTVTVCSECHAGTGTAKTHKPPTHISTTDVCSACHSVNAGWRLRSTFAHDQTLGTCVSCHAANNPAPMRGKTATHIPSNDNCQACHGTIAFRASNSPFSHADASGECIACHNASSRLTVGMPTFHPPTTDACAACHLTTVWRPVKVPMDHAQVLAGGCNTCHNGTRASGKTATHVPTSNVCDACHAVPTATGGTWKNVPTLDHT